MPAIFVAAALLGLSFGSFLNVVLYRSPRGESLASPGSHCPNCGHAIRARHNVPVIAWIALRGACADCHEPISVRYPIVELASGGLFVEMTTLAFGPTSRPALYVYLAFSGVALAAMGLQLLLRGVHMSAAVRLEDR